MELKDRTPGRRSFLMTAGLMSAGVATRLNARPLSPNDKITVALVGCRNMGMIDAAAVIKAGAEIKTICDLDPEIIAKTLPKITQMQGKTPGTVKEYRRVLDDKDIDGVIFATPDHWHAIQTIHGCQAGKDIYIEKPLSHTIQEGQMMRDAARKYNRVVQVGTQRRSAPHVKSAIDYVVSGKLGKVCMIKSWINQLRVSIGNPPDGTPPQGVDYDVCLGPAPKRPFNPNRFHYNWRFFYDYCNTELGNQGIHMLDIGMNAIQRMRGGLANCMPKRISANGGIYWLNDAKEVPDTQVATWDFGDLMLVWEMHSFQKLHLEEHEYTGTSFYGTEGSVVVTSNGWKAYGPKDEVVASDKSTGHTHLENWLECMRSRKQPNGDIEIGRLSTTICHLGNISQRLGRTVHYDPKTETFPGDREANALLTKRYRAPYTLPKI